MRRREPSQHFYIHLSELLSRSDDVPATLAEGCRLVGEHLRVSRVLFRLLDAHGESSAMPQQYVSGVRSLDPLRVSGFDPWTLAQYEHRIHCVTDVSRDASLTGFQQAAFRSAEVRSWIVAPAAQAPHARARLIVHDRTARDWTTREVHVVSAAALTLLSVARARDGVWDAPTADRSESGLRRASFEEAGREHFWRSALEAAHLDTWEWDLRSDSVRWSDTHAERDFGVVSLQGTYAAWLQGMHPEDRHAFNAKLERAKAERSGFAQEFRTLLPGGGVRWRAALGQFHYARTGEPLRIICVLRDITERRRAQEQQETLLAETQHRGRNLLALIGGLIDRCARETSDIHTFQQILHPRLRALARVQAIQSASRHQGALLAELVAAELALAEPHTAQVTLGGTADVRLSASLAQVLALAVHELATNSVKHGALGQGAALEISWRVLTQVGDDRRTLQLLWHERGVQIASDAHRRSSEGFGRELIEQALPLQFGADTAYELKEDGLDCHITVHLDR